MAEQRGMQVLRTNPEGFEIQSAYASAGETVRLQLDEASTGEIFAIEMKNEIFNCGPVERHLPTGTILKFTVPGKTPLGFYNITVFNGGISHHETLLYQTSLTITERRAEVLWTTAFFERGIENAKTEKERKTYTYLRDHNTRENGIAVKILGADIAGRQRIAYDKLEGDIPKVQKGHFAWINKVTKTANDEKASLVVTAVDSGGDFDESNARMLPAEEAEELREFAVNGHIPGITYITEKRYLKGTTCDMEKSGSNEDAPRAKRSKTA